MDGMAFPCPCCLFRTLTRRGALEICPVCYWQDEDGYDKGDSHNLVSLASAHAEFAAIRASDLIWIGEVRAPLLTELPVQSGYSRYWLLF